MVEGRVHKVPILAEELLVILMAVDGGRVRVFLLVCLDTVSDRSLMLQGMAIHFCIQVVALTGLSGFK